MMTDKEYDDDNPSHISQDVDALLQAIHQRTSGEIKEFMEDERDKVAAATQQFGSYSELADAWELDIRDFTSSEINR